jgi:hypothetical protein
MASSKLLPCSVGDGMFSTEVAVELQTDSSKIVSLFVDKSLVVEKDGQFFLRVTVVGDNGKPDHQTVLLPSEAFETGSRWLSVRESVLQAA